MNEENENDLRERKAFKESRDEYIAELIDKLKDLKDCDILVGNIDDINQWNARLLKNIYDSYKDEEKYFATKEFMKTLV